MKRWLSNSERWLRWILRKGSSYMTRLRRKAEALTQEDKGFQGKQPEALKPSVTHLNVPFNESTASEFRRLTEEDKNQFWNSLDANGKRNRSFTTTE